MNRTFRTLIVAATLAVALARPAVAEVADGGVPGEWLLNYAGARNLGMGGVGVSLADDALGALWNPAGLPFMDQNQLMFENARLFEESSINSFGFAVPGNWLPTFGLSVVSLGSGEFERTNEMNNPLGTFRNRETAYLFTLAKGFSRRFSIGTNFKYVQQTVEDYSAGGFGVDLGALYQITPTLRGGASIMNLGGPAMTLRDDDGVKETYPTQMRGGFALTVFNGRGLIAAEVDHSGDTGMRFKGGSEYWVQNLMALRLGMEDNRVTGGLSYRFAPQYQMDYGVADHVLGLTHRVGLRYRFGGFFASSQAEPELFSPTGEKATTQIRLNARTKVEAENWNLEFVDKRDQVIRRFGGPGVPPPHVEWDGKDENGLPVADGTYTYRLVVKDHEGRILTSSTRKVHISTGGPQGQVPVTTEP